MRQDSERPVGLPDRGESPDEIRRRLADAASHDLRWRDGRGWALVYDLPGEHADLIAAAAAQFGNENGLSHSAFPSAGRFESAVIAMVASVVAPATPASGIFTSGGTESILLAVKSARDRPGASGDRIVVPATAHPAFGKAAQLLGLHQVSVPVGVSGAVDPAAVADAVDERTLLIAGSAPNFPFGVIDPITELGQIAAEREVPFHVDAALGGLFLPFLDSTGAPPEFGLDVRGVTSVSVDLHKYGYGAKGASVLLFADPALRRAAYYVDDSWPGGAYAAGGLLGTRPVGPAAAAYATLMSLGRSGYRAVVESVMSTTRALQQLLTGEFGFEVIGSPAMSVFAAGADLATVATVARGLGARGWWIDTLRRPPALHLIVFPRHAELVPQLRDDITAALADPRPAAGALDLSSYGVMVRGDAAGSEHESLLAHLDRRYDG